jgi:hypothetical protein
VEGCTSGKSADHVHQDIDSSETLTDGIGKLLDGIRIGEVGTLGDEIGVVEV